MDEQRDFTYDLANYNGLPNYVKQLKTGGKHYVIILVKFKLKKILFKPVTQRVLFGAVVRNAELSRVLKPSPKQLPSQPRFFVVGGGVCAMWDMRDTKIKSSLHLRYYTEARSKLRLSACWASQL